MESANSVFTLKASGYCPLNVFFSFLFKPCTNFFLQIEFGQFLKTREKTQEKICITTNTNTKTANANSVLIQLTRKFQHILMAMQVFLGLFFKTLVRSETFFFSKHQLFNRHPKRLTNANTGNVQVKSFENHLIAKHTIEYTTSIK